MWVSGRDPTAAGRAAIICIAFAAGTGIAIAQSLHPLSAFAAHCFSPFLTAERAAQVLPASHDFYDLAPFSNVPPSAATTAVTPGTDRRCAVTMTGDHGAAAARAAKDALAAEGITNTAPLPSTHADVHAPGTMLLAARYLNLARVAVVHAGTRPGADGVETFLSVERLTTEASAEVGR